MIKTKTFYSIKGKNNSWHPLEKEHIEPSKTNNDFSLIEVVMQLVNLYGLIFPTKVPAYILVNNIYHFLTIKYKKDARVIVGYANEEGQFYKSFESDKEKKAKKALASFLKSKGIA